MGLWHYILGSVVMKVIEVGREDEGNVWEIWPTIEQGVVKLFLSQNTKNIRKKLLKPNQVKF